MYAANRNSPNDVGDVDWYDETCDIVHPDHLTFCPVERDDFAWQP
jgi:cytochrome c5